MITVEDVAVSYGNIQVLWGVSMAVTEDDGVVAVVGPNGAGKSTLLAAMSGLVALDAGSIRLWGEEVSDLHPTDVTARGFVHVPEERNLFGDMTVEENLEMGAYTHREDVEESMREVFDLFPVLGERRGQRVGSMSGGEQQMLAIGRALMARPRILALDEPSEGLAPQLTRRLFEKIAAISERTTVLLVAQHVDEALSMADRAYLMENGEFVAEDTGPALLESDHVAEAYL